MVSRLRIRCRLGRGCREMPRSMVMNRRVSGGARCPIRPTPSTARRLTGIRGDTVISTSRVLAHGRARATARSGGIPRTSVWASGRLDTRYPVGSLRQDVTHMRYWFIASPILAVSGASTAIVGAHDLILGLSWQARAVGALSIAVGVAILIPLVRARRTRGHIPPLAALSAAIIAASTAIGVAIVQQASGLLTTWRIIVPIAFVASASALVIGVRRQERQPLAVIASTTLRAPFGKIVAANAGIIAFVQIAVSLLASSHPLPPRPIITAAATPSKSAVRIDRESRDSGLLRARVPA